MESFIAIWVPFIIIWVSITIFWVLILALIEGESSISIINKIVFNKKLTLFSTILLFSIFSISYIVMFILKWIIKINFKLSEFIKPIFVKV